MENEQAPCPVPRAAKRDRDLAAKRGAAGQRQARDEGTLQDRNRKQRLDFNPLELFPAVTSAPQGCSRQGP